MPKVSSAPYPQPYAGPSLSSVAAASLAPGLKPAVRKVLTLPEPEVPDAIRWLLSGPEPHFLLAVGSQHAWLVDLVAGTVKATHAQTGLPLCAFLPDGRYVHRPGTLLMRRSVTAPSADRGEIVTVENLGADGVINAFYPMQDDFIVLVQKVGHDDDQDFLMARATRKPYSRALSDVAWRLSYGERTFLSPVLSDGTLVLSFADRLLIASPAGKEVIVLKVALLPNLVSVDDKNRIWGFFHEEDESLSLVGYTVRGELVAKATGLSGKPVQPPVPLRDGRVVVVTSVGVMLVDENKVAWDRGFPGGVVQVTATWDSTFLVRHKDSLALMGPTRSRLWSLRLPDRRDITSNPVITSDGGVCVAAGLEVYCLDRD